MRNKQGQFISRRRPKWLREKISKKLKGKKKSKEFKENLRKVRTGWKLREETKKKIGKKLKGNKNSVGKEYKPTEKVKKKISDGLKKAYKEGRKKAPFEGKKRPKFSKKFRGENHWNWNPNYHHPRKKSEEQKLIPLFEKLVADLDL